MSTSEHDLPPQALGECYEELQAWMRANYGGPLACSVVVIRALLSAGLDKAKGVLAAYMGHFPPGTAPGLAFGYAEDGGLWVLTQLIGGHPLGEDYFNAPDGRTFPKLTDPAQALARAKGQGIGWDGTELCSADELPLRLDLAKTRAHQSYYAKVDPDFLVYATIAAIPADSIHYTHSTFAEWLEQQGRTLQDA